MSASSTTLEALREDLSSCGRVRTRLVTAPDSSLPRALSVLLPRLLRRMDGNWGEMMERVKLVARDDKDADAENELQFRKNIHAEYNALIDHALDRIELNKELDTTPTIEAMADFVASLLCGVGYYEKLDEDDGDGSCCCYRRKKETTISLGEHREGRNYLSDQPGLKAALRILKVGLGRVHGKRTPSWRSSMMSAMKASIMALESFHSEMIDRPRSLDVPEFNRAVRGNANTPERKHHHPWVEASWLVLETIARVHGVHPIGLASSQRYEQQSSNPNVTIVEGGTLLQRTVSSIAPLVGDGTYDLFLDLILFHPSSCRTTGFCGGLSQRGTMRMRAPVVSSDSDPPTLANWMGLKLAVLRIAVGVRKGEGVFSWKNALDKENVETANGVIGEDDCIGTARALVLLIISSSSHRSMRDEWTRRLVGFARSTLQYQLDEGRVMGLRSTKKSEKPDAVQSSGDCIAEVLVYATTMLLCLVLGDANAHAALQIHREEWDGSDGSSRLLQHILQNTAGATADGVDDGVRSCLPPETTSVILNLVADRLHNQENESNAVTHQIELLSPELLGEEMVLLINLSLSSSQRVLQLNEPNNNLRRFLVMQRGWGDGKDGPPASAARLLRALAAWLGAYPDAEDSTGEHFIWLQGIRRQILDVATTFLQSSLQTMLNEDTTRPPRRDIARMEEGEGDDDVDEERNVMARAPYRLRGRIAAQRRIEEARRITLAPPIEIRRNCIRIIQDLAEHACLTPQIPGDAIGQGQSLYFDIPILLLNCLVVDAELTPHAAIALEHVLLVFKSNIEAYRQSFGSNDEALLIQSAAPLLPALLSASSSEAHIARRTALEWTANIVRVLDSDAAIVLCSHLADDDDFAIAKTAIECINSINAEKNQVTRSYGGHKDDSCAILFLDCNNDLGSSIMHAKLDQEINALARELGISEDGASTLLQQHCFSRDQVMETIRKSENLEETLDRFGVRWRCSSLLSGGTCDIYDDTDFASRDYTCTICYDDDLTKEDMHSLPCRHLFCKVCFCNYLEVKLEDPRSLLDCSCPKEGCNERIAESDVNVLLPEKLAKWRKCRFDSFVNSCDRCRWCPGVDCSMIAYSETGMGRALCANCKACFCFHCRAEPHSPAVCSDVEQFMKLRLHSSDWWISKNAKRCPGRNCGAPIQKNTGCNHITCTQCGCHFCYLCASIIGEDGNLDRHVCNRYKPTEQCDRKRDEFYLFRYEACADGEMFAKDQLNSLLTKGSSDDKMLLSSEDFDVLVKAVQCLIETRKFLGWTYVIAWADTSRESSVQKDIFESQQATMEIFTEKLSKLTETKPEDIYTNQGERGVRMHSRALSFHSCVLEKYTERMIEYLPGNK